MSNKTENFLNYKVEDNILEENNANELTEILNNKLIAINNAIVECEDVELLNMNYASAHAIYEEVSAKFSEKTYNIGDISRETRKYIADIVEMTETDIQNIILADDVCNFWNSEDVEITRNAFDYTNKCLVNHKYTGKADFEMVRGLLVGLSNANMNFAKDALYQEYLNKAQTIIKQRIDSVSKKEEAEK